MRRIPTPTLFTANLILRPPRLRDTPQVYRCLRDPDMSRFIPVRGPYRPWHALGFVLRSIVGRWTGRRVDYLYVSRDTGEIAGCDMYYRIRWADPREAEVGSWIARPYWGQRLVLEPEDTFFRYTFGTLGLHRLIARVEEGHRQAISVIENGPRDWYYEGTLRDQRFRGGRYRSLRLYSLLRTDPTIQALFTNAPPPSEHDAG